MMKVSKVTSYTPELVKNLQKAETITDRLGLPIDDDIKLLVATLWSHDVPTSNSCGGHVDRRNGGPFVEIESSDVLERQRRLALIRDDEGERMQLMRDIKRINLAEQGYVLSSLDRFYTHRKNNVWTRLVIQAQANGRGKLMCQGVQFIDAFRTHDERQEWLVSAKQEMSDFAQFLIKELKV